MSPENTLSEEAKTVKAAARETFVYRTNKHTYSFKNFQTLETFSRDIYNSTITLKKVNKDQSKLLFKIMDFKSKIKPQNPENKPKKMVLRTYMPYLM